MKYHIDPTKLFTHNKLVCVRANNYEGYWLNGSRHNPNGSAYRLWYNNGQLWHEEYWLNGEQLTQAQFLAKLNK